MAGRLFTANRPVGALPETCGTPPGGPVIIVEFLGANVVGILEMLKFPWIACGPCKFPEIATEQS